MSAPPAATEGDGEHLAAIREFFLERQESYSLEELAVLWRLQVDDVRDIYRHLLPRRADSGVDGPDSPRIGWADAAGTSVTFNILRPFDIERALGSDFTRVRPETWQTVPVLIHVPRFIAEAIALEACIPPRLPLDARIEHLLIELFTYGEPTVTRTNRRSE